MGNMKCVVFRANSAEEMQKKVNDWLSDAGGIDVYHALQSEGGGCTITLFYKEHLKNQDVG
jgi:hypothetical protein